MSAVSTDETLTPVSNSVKYDRQLRLWGDQGQKCLESSRVCLVNATAVGVETLKNLILPGIGSFTIIDSNLVTQRDLGTNFFVTKDDIGMSRASVTCSSLLEMNPDVKGCVIDEPLETLLDKNIDLFKAFSIVVVCLPVDERSLKRLSACLWVSGIPLMIPRACGLWACVRTVCRRHYVIEPHPEAVIHDLRLDKLDHVPGLEEFAEQQDLDKMPREQHSHTPFLLLLIKFLDKWYEIEGFKQLPLKYKDKKRFQQLLLTGMKPKEGNSDGADEEENFQEAIKSVNTAFTPTTVPVRIQQLFDHYNCLNLSSESDNFWILLRAIKEFVLSDDGKGCLPLNGAIPDMTSDSMRYIKLQNLYQDAAKYACACVTKHVHDLLRSVGRNSDSISLSEIRRFCRNSAHLDVICTSSLEVELGSSDLMQSSDSNPLIKCLPQAGENDATNLLNIYILFLAADEFFSCYQKYPGDCDSKYCEMDVSQLKTCISNLISKLSGTSSPTHFSMPDELVAEMVRFGGSIVHSMASFIGGVASHEVIKLLTNQYVPIDELFVYNGVTCTSSAFKF